MISKDLIHEGFESGLRIGFSLSVVAEIEYGDVVVFVAKSLEDSVHDVSGHAGEGDCVDDACDTFVEVVG